jgi:hypothetical protein
MPCATGREHATSSRRSLETVNWLSRGCSVVVRAAAPHAHGADPILVSADSCARATGRAQSHTGALRSVVRREEASAAGRMIAAHRGHTGRCRAVRCDPLINQAWSFSAAASTSGAAAACFGQETCTVRRSCVSAWRVTRPFSSCDLAARSSRRDGGHRLRQMRGGRAVFGVQGAQGIPLQHAHANRRDQALVDVLKMAVYACSDWGSAPSKRSWPGSFMA